MAITFYDFPMAPSPRRARIILAEKNVPHDVVIVDMMKAEQLGEAYLAINPSATIPALKLDDGSVLTDNAGIAAYLEAAYSEKPLLGETALEKGMVASWNAKIEFEGIMAMADALRNSSPRMKGRALTGQANWEQIPELAERGMKRVEMFFEMLDQRLERRDFVAIDSFSLADITALVAVDFAKMIRKQPSEDHKNIARWRADMNARPSIAT